MSNVYRQLILNELLDRYERSRLFKAGESKQPVLFRFSDCHPIISRIRTPEEKRACLDALEELSREHFISYTWIKYEAGNLVDKVYLTGDPAFRELCYQECARYPKRKQLETLLKMLQHFAEKMPDGDLKEFLLEREEEVRRKQDFPAALFKPGVSLSAEEAQEKNHRLLHLLQVMAENDSEQLERVLSARLFGDSKYFERELKRKTISILKNMEQKTGGISPEADEAGLLETRGIFRWPEIIEFCGPVRMELDSGERIDFAPYQYGACINSVTARHIQSIQMERIQKVLLIENKANYSWYISNQIKEGELVLYHGGFYSPVKGRWFRLLADAGRKEPLLIQHWGDIDLGGFRMFHRLKTQIFPALQPYLMDRGTLEANLDVCQYIGNETYREALRHLMEEEDYAEFTDVIRYMLDQNVRLEQEQLIGNV